MIPLLLEKVGFYDRPGINIDLSPYDVAEDDALQLTIAKGVPQQVECDCGIFTTYFAEQLILGKEKEMSKDLDAQLLHQDIAVSLYFHGKKKQEDGYLTNDEFREKLLDRR
ncbi:uncharacterized protein LOC133818064 [Humulus lupulus]|uniref:uncharacterized protein LOC133818064 n=1 Tax=Humulus lupulus TaxID=3486 RepID=UPI002B409274|nr:uncharacterized protein LOC133818064 [Humulus lupulus]